MTKIKDATIAGILPEWLGNEIEIKCLSYAMGMELKRLLASADRTVMFADISHASGDILDALAMEMDTPYYDENLPIETKRELVEKTSPWHSKAGTKSAVEELISTIFGEGSVSEWFDYNDDPYFFKILTNAQMTPELFDQFNMIIEKVKNIRSHLRNVEVHRTVEHPEYFRSGINAVHHISITNSPQRKHIIEKDIPSGIAAISTPHIAV